MYFLYHIPTVFHHSCRAKNSSLQLQLFSASNNFSLFLSFTSFLSLFLCTHTHIYSLSTSSPSFHTFTSACPVSPHGNEKLKQLSSDETTSLPPPSPPPITSSLSLSLFFFLFFFFTTVIIICNALSRDWQTG